MTYIIQDLTLYDPELTSGTFATLDEIINHLKPTLDSTWGNKWFIRPFLTEWHIGVFNTLDTDSWGSIAVIKEAPNS